MGADKKRVLVVGDVMLDRYFHVSSDRLAQEANIPVWDEVRVESRLGGAANLAHNLKSIGRDEVEVHLAGIYGGPESSALKFLAARAGVEVVAPGCGDRTMVKDRVVGPDMRYLLRKDNMRRFDDDDTDVFSVTMERVVESSDYDAVVVSDYDKGTVSSRVASLLGRYPVRFVDSKRRDLRPFRGFTAVKLNELEYSAQASNRSYGTSFEGMFDYCIVTKGAAGAEVRQYDSSKSDGRRYVVHSEEFPLDARVRAVDVTGCGDTHTAAALFAFLKTGDIRLAVKFANRCASAKVQVFGTAAVSEEEKQ